MRRFAHDEIAPLVRRMDDERVAVVLEPSTDQPTVALMTPDKPTLVMSQPSAPASAASPAKRG